MGSATFLSRILGLIRELVMAAMFGASGLTDAFGVAYRIPNILRDLFAEGAFSAAFVPIFTEVKQKSPQDARKLLWSLFVLLSVVTGIISILIIIFAPQIVLLFPGFAKPDPLAPDKIQVTITLIRIMSPFLVFISLAALFMGVLNTLRIFFVPSFAPAVFNIIMILSMILLPSLLDKYGINTIISMGIGVVVGGLFQCLIQVPLLFKRKYGPVLSIDLFSYHSRRIINRMGLGTIGIAATQINILITTILATGTVVGAVTWLNYAFRLFQFPVGILSVSISGSNLVHFSSAWKEQKTDQAISILQSSYFLSFVTIIPAMALLYALSSESVNLVLQRGAFLIGDTEMTGMALRYYLLGLPFYGLYKMFVPIFYTLDRPHVPIIVSIVAVTINIIFCLIFTPIYGFKVLAIGVSLSMFLNSLTQGVMLKKVLKLPLSFFINVRIIKVLIAGIACLLITKYLGQHYYSFNDNFLMRGLTFVWVGCTGALTYALVLAVLGEFSTLKRFKREIRK